MLAIRGIYDGKRVRLLEKVPKGKPYKVVVTFVEELDSEESLREFTSDADSFDFWMNPAEDLYDDFIPKKGNR